MPEYIFDYDKDIGSPFQPGKPVSPYNFVGRSRSIDKILRYARSASEGDVQHFFLTGERGIGKTSLAKFTAWHMEKYLGTTCIYVSSHGHNTLKSFIRNIVNEMLYFIPISEVKGKVSEVFGNMGTVDILGSELNFQFDCDLNFILGGFPYYIGELINNINPRKGVFLIIDDINRLSESGEFVNWYKSFADTIELNSRVNLKLYILFVSYKEKFASLVSKEPSFGRIFHYEQLDSLSDFEIREFFIDMFQKRDISCDSDALGEFVYYSQGLPLIMQEIGDSAYWFSKNGKITQEIALKSIIAAGKELGNKQLIGFLDALKDTLYEKILNIIGENRLFEFSKKELLENMFGIDEDLVDSFIGDMLLWGVLSFISPKSDEKYVFNIKLIYTYFLINSIKI